MTDLDAIRERHRLDGPRLRCALDHQNWPCDAAQAIARVADLEAALREYLGAAHDGLGPEDEHRLRAVLASEPQP